LPAFAALADGCPPPSLAQVLAWEQPLTNFFIPEGQVGPGRCPQGAWGTAAARPSLARPSPRPLHHHPPRAAQQSRRLPPRAQVWGMAYRICRDVGPLVAVRHRCRWGRRLPLLSCRSRCRAFDAAGQALPAGLPAVLAASRRTRPTPHPTLPRAAPPRRCPMEWWDKCGAEQDAVVQLSRQGLMPHQLLEKRPQLSHSAAALMRGALDALEAHDRAVAAWRKGKGKEQAVLQPQLGEAGDVQQQRVRLVRDALKAGSPSEADLEAIWRNLVPEQLDGKVQEGQAGLQQLANMLLDRPVVARGLLDSLGPFRFEYDHSGSGAGSSGGGGAKAAGGRAVGAWI
jgi:hypothetical protein